MELRISLFSPLSLTVALFFLIPDAVQGNAIASWWVDTDEGYAPQVFRYNDTTRKIYSSLCNSISTPIFAQNESTALETTISPASGTSIASLGYLSGSTIEANVFYVADLNGEGTIASASYTCNTTTGTWFPSASASSSSSSSSSSYNTYISNGTNCASTAPSIDPIGGLSALYISNDDGMRVFFKTAEFQTHYLQYQSSGSCTGWSYVGIASNLTTGHEVSSGFLSSKPKVWSIAQTVFVNESAEADTQGEIELSTSDAGGVSDLWSINRMPTQIIAELKEDNSTVGILTNMSTTSDSAYRFIATNSWGFTLSSFSATAARLGVSTNSNGIPSVFYIGSDGYLRRFASDTQGHWHEDDSEDDSKWPVADADNADFGTAYDSSGNRIWMFYESGGAMIQVYQSSTDVWEQFTTLANYNASLDTSGSASSSTSGSSGSGSSSGSSGSGSGSGSSSSAMSASTKVGLGIGLGLGIPLACAAAALVFFLLRRRRRPGSDKYQYPLSETTGSPGGASSSLSPPTPGNLGPDQNQGYWQNGVWIEKTATMYYTGGGPGAVGQRRNEQLGELPTIPVYEMPVDRHRSDAHEMPTTT